MTLILYDCLIKLYISEDYYYCENKIKELMKKINSPITTIPGFGPVLGAIARKMCNIIYAVLKSDKNHIKYLSNS